MSPKVRKTKTKSTTKKSKKKGLAAVARTRRTATTNLPTTNIKIMKNEQPLSGPLTLSSRLKNAAVNTLIKIKTKLTTLFRKTNETDSSKV